MSYDLYSYSSPSAIPDVAEARGLVDSFNADEEEGRTRETVAGIKEKIAAALTEHNSRLQPFRFDHAAIAKAQNITEREARAQYQHIELNPPDDDLAIQLTVYGDHVFITVPYGYRGSEADQVFSQLSNYLKVIRRAAGFFVYDPQTDKAFDPEQATPFDRREYERIVRNLPWIIATGLPTKQWWKFW